MDLATILSNHQTEDILLYLVFLLGQLIYMMKRAGFSMRAGRAPSRWRYITNNWDILTFRTVLEFIVVYVPIRHYSPNQILGIFHIDLSNISWLWFLNTSVSSPISVLAAGIGSDGIFDWFVDWASRSPRVPDAIKKWLSEEIPPMPLAK